MHYRAGVQPESKQCEATNAAVTVYYYLSYQHLLVNVNECIAQDALYTSKLSLFPPNNFYINAN